MLYTSLSFLLGMLFAGLITSGVFRVHSEFKWMKAKKKCQVCEMPKSGTDLLPIIGDMKANYRCKSCKSYVKWQYVAVELAILAIVMFHSWRYQTLTWIPSYAEVSLLAYFARDVIFSMFLVIIFIYDLKFQLILDKYSIPGITTAFIFNALLGFSIPSMFAGMLVLTFFFLIQFAASNGKLVGAGDVRMGPLMGAMLGLTGGILALFLAYVIGAFYGIVSLLIGKNKAEDQIPFGTFLSIAIGIVMVFGEAITKFFL